MPTRPPLRKVEPHEALTLPPIPSERTLNQAVSDALTAEVTS